MSTNKTSNLNLHSWVAEDAFKRAEFNENFAAIDAAVGELRDSIIAGTYTGDGTEDREINLGFRPRAVLLTSKDGYIRDNQNHYYGGLVLDNSNGYGLYISDSGFTLYGSRARSYSYTNVSGCAYHYIAIR